MKTAEQMREMRDNIIKKRDTERKEKEEKENQKRWEERKHQLERLMPEILKKIEEMIFEKISENPNITSIRVTVQDCLILDDIVQELRVLGYSVNLTMEVGGTSRQLFVEWETQV